LQSLSIETISFWLAIAATVAFAITAVLAIADHGVDIFGVVVLGVITAIGGGTMRDLILDVPVFWAKDLIFAQVAVLSSLLAFAGRSFFTQPQIFRLLLYVDGLGAALFGMQGAMKTWTLNFGLPLAPLLLGVLTAIGGGLIRDVLAGRKTLLMTSEIYAIPVVIGCAVMMLCLRLFPTMETEALIGCTILTFTMRFAAIYWNLSAPAWMMTKSRHT
jgi:uncharacterized membrane protein YeiH